MGRMGGGGGGGGGGTNQRLYSVNANDYKLLEDVGYGASATVYRAIYIPFNEVVAVKCVDLDCCNSNLDDIRREAQTMSLIDHPSVIRAYCSFVVDRNLWVVMPFMAEGSCLHLMKIAYPDGFDEPAICTILKETLKALEYLHRQGHIHRDVKAGNILLDSNGVVKLADFGVSACMFDTGERQRSRNTFVGTPCWMAPEVLQPGSGYHSKADIWSFGITALELAHGHAPFSKYPPMKVLLMTMQNAPPGLDYDRDKKFSKLFKEMVSMCLVKDQTKRPTSEKLFKHSFFKQAKPPEVSVKKLFADLPPLWNRVKALQLKDAAQLALKRMPSAEQEALSQSEYQRGVSAWNFDIEDLKAQASLIRDDYDDDDDDITESKEDDEIMRTSSTSEFIKKKSSTSANYKDPSYHRSSLGKGDASDIVPDQSEGHEESGLSSPGCSSQKDKAFPSDLAEACYDEKLSCRKNGIINETMASTSEADSQSKAKIPIAKFRQTHSGPLVPNVFLGHPHLERSRNLERGESEDGQLAEKTKFDVRKPSFSGPLMLPNRASANSLSAPIKSSGGFRDSLDDKSKTNLVQIKGRFSVTSENLDLAKDIPLGAVPRRSSQGSPLRKSASVGDWMFESKQMPGTPTKEHNNSSFSASVVPHLQNLFQQTTLQQELIASLLNSLQVAEVDAAQNGKLPPLPHTSEITESNDSAASQRERLLLLKIAELQARTISLTDELNEEKSKYKQLQQQIDALSSQENDYRGEMSRIRSNMCIA